VTTRAKPCRLRWLIMHPMHSGKARGVPLCHLRQKDALSECRKAWARSAVNSSGGRRFHLLVDNAPPQEGSSLFVPPKNESRISPVTLRFSSPEGVINGRPGIIDPFLETFTEYIDPGSGYLEAKSDISLHAAAIESRCGSVLAGGADEDIWRASSRRLYSLESSLS